MTDTGQVPGEGLPESAGMVEQPGAPAHGAYTYLSETTAEDEDLLLLPGAQGAWGNEVPPPAPEPVVETVHEPGPHETAGRDSGSVDLGGVRLPNPTPPAMPVPPTTPRRPLHLGPPIPDASASPVRSLADRGPAGMPARQPGPATTGPEYLDVPQLRETSPQGATPWGAAATAQAPASTEAQAAETVVPARRALAEPQAETHGAAQAAVARLTTEAAVAVAPAPDAGQMAQGQDWAYAVETGQALEGAAAEAVAGGPDAAYASEPGRTPDAAHFPDAGQGPDTGFAADAGQGTEAVFASGAGQGDAAFAPGTGFTPDAGESDAAFTPDAGQSPEAAYFPDAVQGADGAYAPEPGQDPEAAFTPGAGQGDAVVTANAGQGGAAIAAGAGQGGAAFTSDAGQSPEAAYFPDAAQGPDGAFAPGDGNGPEAVYAPEATHVPEAPETGQQPEPAFAPDAGQVLDAGQAQPPAPVEVPAQPQASTPFDVAAQAHEPTPVDMTAQAQEAAPAEVAAQPEPAQTLLEATSLPAAPHADEAQLAQDEAQLAPDDSATPAAGTPVPAHAAPPLEPTQAAEPVPDPQLAHQAQPQFTQDDQSAAPAQPQPLDADAYPVAAEPTPTPVAPIPSGPQLADPAAQFAEQAPQPHAPVPAAPAADTASADAMLAQEPLAQAADPAELPEATEQFDETTGIAPAPELDQPLGQFVPVEGSVPTTPHLAPTPPHPITLPMEEPETAVDEPVAMVPAPREADLTPVAETNPEVVQQAEDLDTRAAEQEESTAVVADVRESTGPAAPGYDEAEREAVLKVMRERRDIRNGFRSDPIPHDVLLRVLEAAHTAPSVGHSQPWDFVVIRSADTRRAMHELAARQREAYAKSLPKGRAKQFKELKIEAILDTPVNIVVTADPTRGGRHTLGRHTQPQMAPYSSALAVENLWLAARAEGLGVGWVSFFDEREMVRALGLPEHLEVVAYLCVGYVDEFPDEPELMQAGWSKRRPLSWVVHEETYGRRALPGEEPHDLLAETVAGIRPLDAKALGEAWERQKRMTKPPGSLGMLEIISAQLSGLSRQCPPPIPEPAAVAIFAGDHGVHAQGVTPWPQEVTAQMVANFLGGGAVCNAFASQVGAEVCVVDVGVASELPATPGLLPRKIRAGTSDMTTGLAMTREEAKQAIEVGIETARDLVAAGNKALLTGEMGIANTTASAALISVFTDTDPAEVTGRGTGINDETLARKTEVVRRAIDLHQPDPADPIGVLAAVGGFEHAAMVGLLLGGASLRTPVILDGVSAGAAALVARAIAPEVLAACIAGHRSAEPGHVAALNKLGLRPLVDLDLRLGEGTGALLALPLVQSTARAMHEVATFDSAGVTEK